MTSFSEIKDLEKVYAMRILYALHARGKMNKQELREMLTPSRNIISNRMAELVPLGLVTVEIVKKGNRTIHCVSLTEKGERVAKKIIEMAEILQED